MHLIIKNLFTCSLLAFLVLIPRNVFGQEAVSPFILSADISYIEELEANGAVFKEAGQADDIFAILARNGVNTIRLRLWHTPAEGWYDLESTIALAERTKAAGMQFLLDFHYSDTWADPGKQFKPAAWTGLSFDVLRDSIYTYTHAVLSAMKDREVLPAYVQIGNEISQGLLWDEGRVGGNFNSALQWSQLRTLLGDAIRAVRDVEGDKRIQTILHTDRGGDVGGATWFFDNITSGTVDFDMIGLSYYPWWHGSLEAMQNTVNTVAAKYGKPVLLAETAYPWTLQWYDNTNNLVGLPEHLLPGYEDLPDAQYRFLRDVIDVVRNIPDSLGAGISYWAPEFMAVPGVGSVWENVALFDNNGELLPAIQAFSEAASVNVESQTLNDAAPAIDAFPNPFLDRFQLHFENPIDSAVSIALYDVLGRKRLDVIGEQWLLAGKHQIELDGEGLQKGVYLGVIRVGTSKQSLVLVKR